MKDENLILNKIRESVRHNLRQYTLLLALVVIMIIFQITTGGILLRPINVSRLIGQNAYILYGSVYFDGWKH